MKEFGYPYLGEPTDLQRRNLNRWITNLESDIFRQFRGALGNRFKNGNHSYCCLGLSIVVTPGLNFAEPVDDDERHLRGYQPETGHQLYDACVNNDDFESSFGLDSSFQNILAEFNDSKKWNFKKIAAVLKDIRSKRGGKWNNYDEASKHFGL